MNRRSARLRRLDDVIAVPSAIKHSTGSATLGGNIRHVPMLTHWAFVSMFVIGPFGHLHARPAVDVHIHHTYFSVAQHSHVLFALNVRIFAASTTTIQDVRQDDE